MSSLRCLGPRRASPHARRRPHPGDRGNGGGRPRHRVALRRRAPRGRRPPDRRELCERLLRRRAGRRHPRTDGTAEADPVGSGQSAGGPRRGVDRLGRGRLRRARAGARDPARADPGGGRARPRGCAALLGRTASLRRAGSRRVDGLRLLRAHGDVRLRLRDGGDRAGRRLVVRRRDGVPRRRDPGGQQPPRHPHGRGQRASTRSPSGWATRAPAPSFAPASSRRA